MSAEDWVGSIAYADRWAVEPRRGPCACRRPTTIIEDGEPRCLKCGRDPSDAAGTVLGQARSTRRVTEDR